MLNCNTQFCYDNSTYYLKIIVRHHNKTESNLQNLNQDCVKPSPLTKSTKSTQKYETAPEQLN